MTVAKKILKVVVGILLGLVLAILLFNLFLNFRYFEFYSRTVSVGEVAGLSDGLVQQGLDYVEESEALLTSGYMKDGSASRIYVTKGDKTTYTKLLEKDGKAYTGHAGGITHFENYLYVGTTCGLDVFTLSDVVEGKESTTKLGFIELSNTASWVTSHGGYIYAGRFSSVGDKSYPADEKHIIKSPSVVGEANCSVISVYKLNKNATLGVESNAPTRILSCIGRVQGGCFTDDGQLILSTSWGLTTSKFYFYDIDDAKKTTATVEESGAPVYFLGTDCLNKVLEGPPMAEEIIALDGRMYIMNESASAKYVFGNFIGGRELYAYELD